MIVIDSSVVLAIYLKEPDALVLAAAIVDDPDPVISAATLLECSIAIRSRKSSDVGEAEQWLDSLVTELRLQVLAVDEVQSRIARAAPVSYGKGTGHPAQLNFGDCFAYALAKAMDVPLLFKGDDFTKTDIRSAL
ncbi:MAG: type II toxin-antitoxin system VapC family toxin [Rhizobiaceae bacterium]|nr:MAG: type II toxin-antitoxin system VapC family toxin [Rhizobiaceae bacterium]